MKAIISTSDLRQLEAPCISTPCHQRLVKEVMVKRCGEQKSMGWYIDSVEQWLSMRRFVISGVGVSLATVVVFVGVVSSTPQRNQMAIGEAHQKIVGIKNEIQSLSVTEQQMLNDKLGTNVLALVEEALTATDVASVRPRGVVVDRFNKSVAMTQAKQDVELSNASTGMTGFSLPGQFTQPTSQAVDIENLYPSSEYEFISYTNPQGMSVMIALDQKGMITARMLSVEPSQWRTLQQQRVFPLFISE